jgi:hypothetical protein
LAGETLMPRINIGLAAGSVQFSRSPINQIGGQLQHPGVVPVYDIGRFGDRPFFTMKRSRGTPRRRL